jgi:rhodanese-related sulfurtransferase
LLHRPGLSSFEEEEHMADTITAKQLKEKIDSGEKFHLVETLLPEEYEKWHLPGAINIHFNKIGKAARDHFDQDDEIVVYCHDEECNASPIAAQKLEKMGYEHVYHFPGGKKAWKEADYPTET